MTSSVGLDWVRLAGPKAFLRDKAFSLLLAIIMAVLMALFLLAFKANQALLIVILVIYFGSVCFSLAIEYWRRRRFYRALINNLSRLDQAYLVLETLEQPEFYDGKILFEALYVINKSMNENIKAYQDEARAFREYIELWIHEVKTPLTALSLMNRDPRVALELRRLDDFVDQVLYFSRAENAERDYLIAKVSLGDIVHEVALRCQPLLLGNSVSFAVQNLTKTVYTDAKWLEFILNQIISNSVKYGSTKIEVIGEESGSKVILTIRDNGVGIDSRDLPRVFEKSFTGRNGRHQRNKAESSTGMGLYIVKTLCEKLGHQIKIFSKLGQGTIVEITFSEHDYYLTKK